MSKDCLFVTGWKKARSRYFSIGFKSLFLFGAVAFFSSPAMATSFVNNYVVFYAQGDCHQEDCISAVYGSLNTIPGIVKIDAAALASHGPAGYKPVMVSFTNLKEAPFQQVMEGIAAQGYNVVSYVIHDLHSGQDVIIPH